MSDKDKLDLQVDMVLSFVPPKLLQALPVWKHGKDDIARCTWYYRCPCKMSSCSIHQSQMSMHLRDFHGLTKSKVKKLFERSRNYYYAHKYDENYETQVDQKHKEIA
tara:strand:+ start:4732 stop:5052 length:321 start_codon:yes stop_codon:yes gene_type:complete